MKLRRALQILLGLLLLWAAVSKLANPTDFLGSLLAYRIPFPRPVMQFIAVTLPWLELLCGLLLLGNLWTESALACTAAMMFIFVVATGQAWARRLDISCGCFDLKIFGLDQSHPNLVKLLESVGFALLRNLVLGGLTFLLLWKRWIELRPAPHPQILPPFKPAKPRLGKSVP